MMNILYDIFGEETFKSSGSADLQIFMLSGTFAGILRSLSINRRAKTEVKNRFN